MAAGRVNSLSLKIGIFLCLFLIFNSSILEIPSLNMACKVRDVCFATQLASKVEIQAFHAPVKCHGRIGDKEVSGFQKGYIACKLFQHASLAFVLLALAGDVEINPGYRSLVDIRRTRGLKIVHLNIRSLR